MNRLTQTFISVIFVLGATSLKGESPHIFWANDEVLPGDTAQILGSGFEKLEGVELLDASKQEWVGVKAIQASDVGLKFIVPGSFHGGRIRYRIRAGGGEVRGTLNTPAVWWLAGDLGADASVGGELRVFGKNFSVGEWVGKLHGLKEVELKFDGDRYHAVARLPKNLPAGKYELMVPHQNGEALTVEVLKAVKWPETLFNVRDFGATGNGSSDDTDACDRALAACEKQHGGVVFFPRGRYKISRTLKISPYTTLRGEGRELVQIFWNDTPQPPLKWLAGHHHFAIEDLSFYCTNYLKFITADKTKDALGNVRISRVRIRANMLIGHLDNDQLSERTKALSAIGFMDGSWLVDLGGENNVVEDCDFLASGGCVALTRCRYSRILRSYLGTGRVGMGGSMVIGGQCIEISGNHYDGRDLATANGAGGLGYGNLKNLYIAHNQFQMISGSNREAITSDAPASYFLGNVASASGNSIVLDHPPGPELRGIVGSAFFIIEGKGVGQWREVIACDGPRVQLDRPLDVAPDLESKIIISHQLSRWLLIGNQFSDTGVAIQLFGSMVDCIASGNKCARVAGMKNISLDYLGMQPSWYVQWLGNRFDEGNYYVGSLYEIPSIESRLSIVSGLSKAEPGCPFLTYGCVAKGNDFLSNSGITISNMLAKTSSNPPSATCREVIVERNKIRNADLGINITAGTANVSVRNNEIQNVTESYRIRGQNIDVGK